MLAFALVLGTLAGGALADGHVPATVVDVIGEQEALSTLAAVVDASGAAEALSGEGPFTVFAPTDLAFLQALERLDLTQEELLANGSLLAQILGYHLLLDGIMWADLVAAIEDGWEAVATAQGEEIELSLRSGVISGDTVLTVVLNGEARLQTIDLEAGNGVVHVIDRVLLPPDD